MGPFFRVNFKYWTKELNLTEKERFSLTGQKRDISGPSYAAKTGGWFCTISSLPFIA